MNSDVRIINLPISRWKEYKALRLEAVRSEPQAYRTTYEEASTSPDEKWLEILGNAEKENKDILFFAEDDGKLVGMTGAFFNKTPETENAAMIYGVYLNKKYRGQGIGKQLLLKVLERLENISTISKAVIMVNTQQTIAHSLYRNLGFQEVKKVTLTMADGLDHEEAVLEKELK